MFLLSFYFFRFPNLGQTSDPQTKCFQNIFLYLKIKTYIYILLFHYMKYNHFIPIQPDMSQFETTYSFSLILRIFYIHLLYILLYYI